MRDGKRQTRSIPIIELHQGQQPATLRLFICVLWARAIATWLGRLLLAPKETGSQSLMSLWCSNISSPPHHQTSSSWGLAEQLDCRYCSWWLPEEDWDLIAVAAEQIALGLVNDVWSEVLSNNAVPWLAYYARKIDIKLQFQIMGARLNRPVKMIDHLPWFLSISCLILLAIMRSSLKFSNVSRISWKRHVEVKGAVISIAQSLYLPFGRTQGRRLSCPNSAHSKLPLCFCVILLLIEKIY